MKKLLGTVAGAVLAVGLAAAAFAQDKPTMGVVVKIGC